MGENLFCPGQSVLSSKGRDNYDKIKWNTSKTESKDDGTDKKKRS